MQNPDYRTYVGRLKVNAAKETELVARAIAIALLGDDADWRQHLTLAVRFQDALATVRKDETLLDLHRSGR
jgi:hypothetical protein